MANGTPNEDEENKEMPEKVKEESATESDKYSDEEDACKDYEFDEGDETKSTDVTSAVEDASSVKYNIKTTPYLQRWVQRSWTWKVQYQGRLNSCLLQFWLGACGDIMEVVGVNCMQMFGICTW